MSIRSWSTTATGNASVAGINFSEGQGPSTVNNSMRELMAQVAQQLNNPSNAGWVAFSATASVASQTTFKIAGDQTGDWVANRAVKLTGGSTTVYASIVSASYTSETTITIEGASGSLSASHTIAWLSSIMSQSLPSDVLVNAPSGTNTFTGAVAFQESVSFSASVHFNDAMVIRPYFKDTAEVVNAIGSTGGGTQDIDLTLGNVVTATVDTSANTFTFSNPSASGRACSFTLILTNGGSQTVNWPASVKWDGGTAPTLTTAGVDVIEFLTVDGGTTWYGFAAGLDMQ